MSPTSTKDWLHQENELRLSATDRLQLSLGVESEAVQRAAQLQIMKHLPEVNSKMQSIWNERDQVYAAELEEEAFKEIQVPEVPKNHYWLGTKHISVLKAPIAQWPIIVIYAADSKPYPDQPDQFDTVSIPLCVEILCNEGPIVNEEELHTRVGWEVEQRLDSILQRLTDNVHICIKMDPSLGGVIFGGLEKPPTITQSLPWARKEAGNETGNYFIFQGKQLEYIVQKQVF